MNTFERDLSLDALRGFAICGMVLSGSVAAVFLPVWMSHAQVPYAKHWDGTIAGITWVDLVFPFFLFAMGVAIPFAFTRKLETKICKKSLFLGIVKRYVLLLFFSFFYKSLHPWVLSTELGIWQYALPILAFFLMVVSYANLPFLRSSVWKSRIQNFGLLSSLVLLLLLDYYDRIPVWSVEGKFILKSDIILNVLANGYLFGSIIWLFAQKTQLARIVVLVFIFGILMAPKPEDGTMSWQSFFQSFPTGFGHADLFWVQSVYSFVGACFNFMWLKYLFIILPGTIIGDFLLQSPSIREVYPQEKAILRAIALVCFALLPINLVGLFGRYLLVNLLLNLALFWFLNWQLKKLNNRFRILEKLLPWAVALLFLGLSLEAFEGGIKKDTSTYSYYFVTTGLAIFLLITLYICNWMHWFRVVLQPMSLLGKNPLFAYVVGGLLVVPLYHFSGFDLYWDALQTSSEYEGAEVAAFYGLAKGLLFTFWMALFTILSVKLKMIWKL